MAEITVMPSERIKTELGQLQDLPSAGPAATAEVRTGSLGFSTTGSGSDRRLEIKLNRSGSRALGARR